MSRYSRSKAALVTALAILFCATQANADSESIFYAFVGHGAHDGYRPGGGLTADKDGNLYGTTILGGSADLGTVFKLTPQGSESILHSFTGGEDGYVPYGAPLLDADGNLYGTAGGGDHGDGIVFRIAPDGTKTVLYSFKGGSDGIEPESDLIADGSGNLYGTTAIGGANNLGTVFELKPDGTETVLYSFKGGSGDGSYPWRSGLWRDANGNLYGTTLQGAASGAGVVYKLSPDGTEKVLHFFTDHDDGGEPTTTLVPDGKGNLYGTARLGGTGNCNSGCGVIFKIASDDTFSVVYSFPDEKAGLHPGSRLLFGNGKRKVLFGTTEAGGEHGRGVVFKLAPNGMETVLHSFTPYLKGASEPSGPLTADPTFTHLFGETYKGGRGRGVVYVLRP